MTNRQYIETKITEMNDDDFINSVTCCTLHNLLPSLFINNCGRICCKNCCAERIKLLSQKYIPQEKYYVYMTVKAGNNKYISSFEITGLHNYTYTSTHNRTEMLLVDFKTACEIRNKLNSDLLYVDEQWVILKNIY